MLWQIVSELALYKFCNIGGEANDHEIGIFFTFVVWLMVLEIAQF